MRGACPPSRDCYACDGAWGSRLTELCSPRQFAPGAGAPGRDAPPGPGAAPWLLLALTAAALRAPPALGLRAGERWRGLRGLRGGGPPGQDGVAVTSLPQPCLPAVAPLIGPGESLGPQKMLALPILWP